MAARRRVGQYNTLIGNRRWRALAFDDLNPAIYSTGFGGADRQESFGSRFGNWSPTSADNGGDTDSPLLRALQKYRNAAAPDGPVSATLAPPLAPSGANNLAAPVFDPSNPPPIFAPPNYYATPPNDSIQKWITSLAGVDADDPTKFSPPPIFSPLYRR